MLAEIKELIQYTVCLNGTHNFNECEDSRCICQYVITCSCDGLRDTLLTVILEYFDMIHLQPVIVGYANDQLKFQIWLSLI